MFYKIVLNKAYGTAYLHGNVLCGLKFIDMSQITTRLRKAYENRVTFLAASYMAVFNIGRTFPRKVKLPNVMEYKIVTCIYDYNNDDRL